MPRFNLGLEFLDLEHTGSCLEEAISEYIENWFKYPEQYLRIKDEVRRTINEKDNFISFPSILEKRETVRFKYNQQSNLPGKKVALIHIMHWNGRLAPYDTIINLIQSTLLPITTLIHIPAGRELNPNEIDYDRVSPDIGKTIFKVRQDVQDIQYLAKYLKQEQGYEEVGIFSYSIGSIRGILASIFYPDLFDFGIFHMVADDYTNAIMKGVSTQDISKEISYKIPYRSLQKLWGTISPGAYAERFTHLPPHIRLVQAQYDFVFGPNNIRKFNEKIQNKRPDVEIENVPIGHATFGALPYCAGIMWRNIDFIYRHTDMKKSKRSKLFSMFSKSYF